jgi:hypothetical protein
MRSFLVRLGTVTITGMLAGALALAAGGPAAAAGNPNGTGQPSQTCLSSTVPSETGNSASAPGSPFNEPSSISPGGTAGGVYAGSQPQNSNNPHSVSEYDVACYQVSQH